MIADCEIANKLFGVITLTNLLMFAGWGDEWRNRELQTQLLKASIKIGFVV
jgi:hypothetical protein